MRGIDGKRFYGSKHFITTYGFDDQNLKGMALSFV